MQQKDWLFNDCHFEDSQRAIPIDLDQENGAVRFSKLAIIGAPDISGVLCGLLGEQFPNLKMDFYTQADLTFIDNPWDKTIEKCKELFSDALVVMLGFPMNRIFNLFLNKVLQAANVSWFFAAIDGPLMYVGPLCSDLFCYECLVASGLFANKKIKQIVSVIDNPAKYLMCSLTSIEITNLLITGHSVSSHKMLSIFLPTMEFSYHKILPVSGCQICGMDVGSSCRR